MKTSYESGVRVFGCSEIRKLQHLEKTETPQTWDQMSLAWLLISCVALGMWASLSEYISSAVITMNWTG